MKSAENIKRIKENPKFEELVRARSNLANILSVAMMAIYFAFVLTVAFGKEFLGMPIGDSVISIGIPLGLLVILLAFALTGIYVSQANARFDRLTKEIIEESK